MFSLSFSKFDLKEKRERGIIAAPMVPDNTNEKRNIQSKSIRFQM